MKRECSDFFEEACANSGTFPFKAGGNCEAEGKDDLDACNPPPLCGATSLVGSLAIFSMM
jgi:hypothetical protein